jgi:anaerobic selenocysteine-containing dehydrogenase|tara:strand:- start:1649 stop:4531 length:2883 start_codon:yes stop_codon:yes gene_type:complete
LIEKPEVGSAITGPSTTEDTARVGTQTASPATSGSESDERAASMGMLSAPPPEQWDDWVEYDSAAWPKKVKRTYTIIPTLCFNCEAACGLLAYVDRETLEVQRFEGNPMHPGSRGRTCAKGPATITQINDSERILYPLKRAGKRGEGKWERTTWDEVLDAVGGRIRKALAEDRGHEVMYHVGRPGHDGYMDRVLQAWGIDGHNSHTNVCSGAARLGYELWQGADRPSPDYAKAKFTLLLSSHLESGHYFNPHAQRITESRMSGAKIAVMDTRLSNTASMADYWMSPWPGAEGAILLAMANILIQEDLFDKDFVRRWLNWEEYMRAEVDGVEATFPNFVDNLKTVYAEFTLEYAESESGVPAKVIVDVAHEIADAGSAFSAHVWRNTASGNLGGWQVARTLQLLNVLTGSVGTPGGVCPNVWDKFAPEPFLKPPPQKVWNELLFPLEYPLTHHEMSFLLPHFLKDERGRLDVYITRVYNPVWTNPDGASWIEVLRDESKVGLHVTMTPTWNETAAFADYVLPMGLSPERHDLQSQETHAGRWIGFRQPVLKVARERLGESFEHTHEANPGEVWEEDEFWINLSWRIDPDGTMGIRKYFESPETPGEKLTVDEYYSWMFEHNVPGLKEEAASQGLSPIQYMRRYGAFEIAGERYGLHESELSNEEFDGGGIDPVTNVIRNADGQPVGVQIEGKCVAGFSTPSRKLEFYSATMKEWGWPEYTLPVYVKSHVHVDELKPEDGEFALIPTFRVPTLIHTRSGNAKWLYEIAHNNPVWMNPIDARKLGSDTGDLVKLHTDIGYFVNRLWVTEGIKPGVVACSHHMGRWRMEKDSGGQGWSTSRVTLNETSPGKWRMRQVGGVQPFDSRDPDSSRVYWREGGVHQNFAFPVHPDPVSGMHCWHQRVRIEKAGPDDMYGDVFADTDASMNVYREWLNTTRPGPGPDNLRRPLWMLRSVKPDPEAYYLR